MIPVPPLLAFHLVQPFGKANGFVSLITRLSSAGPEILAVDSHYSAKFLLIFDCFIPNFKLKYEDLDNIGTDRLDIVIFYSHEIKQRNFLGVPRSQLKTK